MSKRLLRQSQVLAAIPFGVTWLYDRIAEGKIPPPQKAGRVNVWSEEVIDDVVDRILSGEFGGEGEDYPAARKRMAELAKKRSPARKSSGTSSGTATRPAPQRLGQAAA